MVLVKRALFCLLLVMIAYTPTQADEWDGVGTFNDYGFVMAIDGNTMVSGNPLAKWTDGTTTRHEAGEVNIYTRDALGVWTFNHKLHSDIPTAYSGFGWSVAIQDDWLVIGEPLSGSEPTSVHFFRKIDDQWQRRGKIRVPQSTYTSFGWSLALDGKWLAINATKDNKGYVLIYRLNAKDRWRLKTVLQTPNTTVKGRFGYSLALENNTLVVGQSDGAGSVFPGAAYIYTNSAGEWVKTGELHPSHPDQKLGFGTSVDIDQNTIIVGSPHPLRQVETGNAVGAAYIYSLVNQNWAQQAMLVPADPDYPYNNFAAQVAIEGDTVVLSTHNIPLVHVFQHDPVNGWAERPPLLDAYRYSRDGVSARFAPNGYGCGIAMNGGLMATCSGDINNPFAQRAIHAFRGMELVVNGDFESSTPELLPRKWMLKTTGSGAVVCNTGEAFSGNCAYKLTAPTTMLVQKIPPHGLRVGDKLVVTGVVKQTSPEAFSAAFVKVKIPLSNGTIHRMKFHLNNASIGQYVPFSSEFTLPVLPSGPIKVRLFYWGAVGNILVDDLNVEVVRASSSAAWIELPPAP